MRTRGDTAPRGAENRDRRSGRPARLAAGAIGAALLVAAGGCDRGASEGGRAAPPEGARPPAPGAPAEDLHDVAWTAPGTAVAVGDFGSIYRTTDGGDTWRALRVPTDEPLLGVGFAPGGRAGLAVGRAGTVLASSDGGGSWRLVPARTRRPLFEAALASADAALVVGDRGLLLATRDGGRSWRDAEPGAGAEPVLYDVAFAPGGGGPAWVVGEAGEIRRSDDGGASWRRQDSGTRQTLFGVAAWSAADAAAVGLDGLVLGTADGGATWVVHRGDAVPAALGEARPDAAPRPAALYDVAIAPGGRGLAVGDGGTVLATADGGRTWRVLALPSARRFDWVRGVDLAPDGRGLVVGARGLALSVPRDPGAGIGHTPAARGGAP